MLSARVLYLREIAVVCKYMRHHQPASQCSYGFVCPQGDTVMVAVRVHLLACDAYPSSTQPRFPAFVF